MKSCQNEVGLDHELNKLFTGARGQMDWSEDEGVSRRTNEVSIGKNGNWKSKMVKAVHGAIVRSHLGSLACNKSRSRRIKLIPYHMFVYIHSLYLKTVLKEGSMSCSK